MKFHLTIIFLLFTTFLFAQVNLVPNPSFEQYDTCPYTYNIISFAIGWNNCGGTPDYYNSCVAPALLGLSVPYNQSGFQYPPNKNCHAYAGFYGKCPWLNCREYIGTELISPMVINMKYFFSVKVSLANNSDCGINNLGVTFSMVSHLDNSGYSGTPLNFAHIYTPSIITDTTNWVTITGSFVADSAYKYLVFGDLFDDAHTDSLITDTTYTLCSAYYYVDDFCVSVDSAYCNNYTYNCGEGINDYSKSNIKIFPNPATNELILDYELTDNRYFELYDGFGAKRKALTLDCGSLTKRIDLSDFDSGLYFYSVVDRKGNRIKTGKLIVIK